MSLLILYSSFLCALLLIWLTDYSETPYVPPKTVEPPQAICVEQVWDVQSFFLHEE
jgi:hypothetical protein